MCVKNRKVYLLLVALLAVALVVTGCGGAASNKSAGEGGEKVVKIGLITPLTGDVKTFGESTQNAFKLALEQAGMKAGDYKIEYVIADDRNDATEAVNVATKLISQDKVNCIIGPLTSKTTIPVSELCNSQKIPMLTNTATNPKVTVDNGKRKEYAFRACFIDPFQGAVAAKFALENLKKKTAAVLYDQGNDYTIGLANVFKESFEKGGGQVVEFLAYSKDDTDFSAVLTKIAAKNPDILYLPDYYQKVSLIGKQAREKGIKAIFLGGDGWDSPKDLDFATMAGGYFTNHYSADDPRPEVKKFVEEYKAKYGSVPDALATLGYDATNLMLNAIKTANSNDPEKIKEALQNTKDFPAVSGKITIDKDGNPIKAAVILQVQPDKTYKYVATVTP
ncbi:ABC transporter substrate-binding protein [Desulfurispora thermophila]|uniref:ABC transporter substrate-binding protein n=1 Tax=Desulfurispora thermophila TaxID=265470 RepID=UPI000524E4BC